MAPSIWRSKDAQHFQVVHRSQRDPLINDPLAPQHVLKQVNRPNHASGSGTSRADLEAANPELAKQTRPNVGEAALYGIFYDDTEYDYMQHLRPIRGDFHSKRGGKDEEEDVETILINAKPDKQQQKRQQKAQGPITLREDGPTDEGASSNKLDLPKDVLPPEESTMRQPDFTNQMDVKPGIAGLQPDMDPHLRQALEALEDDAFLTLGKQPDFPSGEAQQGDDGEAAPGQVVAPAAKNAQDDDDDVDDFFSQVLAGGEVDEEEFGKEDGEEVEDWRALPPGGDEQMWQPHTWTAAGLAAMKAQRDAAADGGASKEKGGRSRVARSRFSTGTATSSIFSASSKRKPGQRARLAASVAPSLNDGRTEWSMTSSSMQRNQGLSTLDDQFEALQRKYEQDEGFNEEDEDNLVDDEEDDEEQPDLPDDIAVHHEAVFDQFLNSTELVGRRMVDALGPDGVHSSASERLGAWRDALGPLEERYKTAALERKPDDDRPAEEDPTFPWRREPKSSRQTWDVETILSTHSNTTNHPRLIRSRDAVSKAGTAASTSVRGPTIISDVKQPGRAKGDPADEASSHGQDEEDSDYESDDTEVPAQVTVSRNRNETAEEKKARKAAAKESKQARRQEKSARKAAFAAEHKRQVHIATARTADGAAADVGRNGIPLRGGRAALTL